MHGFLECMLFFVLERDHFHVSFLSDDCEPHLSGPHSPDSEEEEDENTGGMDVDDAEGGVFNEEDAIEEYVGGFLGGIDDLNNVASVRNSMECEVDSEAVPIIRDSELSIIDSVSPLTIFCSEVVLTMFDRTIKRLKAVMEMKKWVRKITYDLKRQRQWTSKFRRNRDGRSAKEFHEDSH